MRNRHINHCGIAMISCAVVLMGYSQAHAAGAITGTIRYEGDKVPKMKPIDTSKEEKCHSEDTEALLTETIVIGPDKTFQNVFVHIVGGLPDKDYPVPTEPVILNQEGCKFTPHVIGVRTNQPIKILNSDTFLHNVNAKPKEMRPFNKAMPPSMKEFQHTFTKPEFGFEIRCDVHTWMGAFVSVMDHPFFSVTGEGGGYEISGLDAGTYEVEVWQEFWAKRFGALKFTVTIEEGVSKTVDIVYPYGAQAKAEPK